MFPSRNNGNDPNFFSDQQAFHNRPFFSDSFSFDSRQGEPPPSSFFHMPSSYIPYDLDLELELEEGNAFFQQNHDLLLHQDQPLRGITSILSETIANMVDSSKNEASDLNKKCNYEISQIKPSQKKRSSKRDRHSKINTAQGPRDRRMRLSLKVARDFFDLQDKLGFDKASKTVEWLLMQAKHETRKLSGGYSCSTVIGPKIASSTSEGDVVSGIDDAPLKESPTKSNLSLGVRKDKKSRAVRKAAPRSRELRDIARAKARERTKEKMARKIDETKASKEATSQELHQLGSWSSFETGEESGTQIQNLNPSVDVAMEVDAPCSQEQQQFGTAECVLDDALGIISKFMLDDALGIISKWSPSSSSSICNMHNNGISQEQHQFTDLQSLYKPWNTMYNFQS